MQPPQRPGAWNPGIGARGDDLATELSYGDQRRLEIARAYLIPHQMRENGLPEERIAQTPVERRDASRLMVVHRDSGTIEHLHFADLADLIPRMAPDPVLRRKILVDNPARLYGF